MFFVQHPRGKNAGDERKQNDDEKSGRGARKGHTLGGDVHTVQAADDGGNRHQQGDAGQVFHRGVHTVVQNGAEQLARTFDIVAVDAGHLNGLTDFHDDIIQQVAVIGVLLQPLVAGQAVQHGGVGAQRGRKVDQRGFQPVQLHQVAVAQIARKVFLNGDTAAVDQAQLLLVHGGGAVQQLVDEPHFFAGRKAFYPAGGKVGNYGGIGAAHRDDQLLGQQNAQRDGGVHPFGGIGDLDGDVHDDQGVAVLQTDAGGFLRVGGGKQVGRLNVQGGCHLPHLVFGGGGQADPDTLVHIVGAGQLLVQRAVNFHHTKSHPNL